MGDGADGVFLFILLFAAIVLLGQIAISVYMLAHESNAGVRQLYVRATKMLPELPRARGIVYHLFLSHIWATGQVRHWNARSKIAIERPRGRRGPA